ncbi:MAG: hypothetical protein ABEJ82_09355 [Haloplanus sp.]
MSIAEETREAVRARPFLCEALRAGVVNYRAAAATLDVGDVDAVATALRRYADDLSDRDPERRDARVTVRRKVGAVEAGNETEAGNEEEAVVTVGGRGFAPDAGSATALVATGDVDARALATVLGRLHAAEIPVEAAGVAGDGLAVVVGGRDGARALRVVESALDAVPKA